MGLLALLALLVLLMRTTVYGVRAASDSVAESGRCAHQGSASVHAPPRSVADAMDVTVGNVANNNTMDTDSPPAGPAHIRNGRCKCPSKAHASERLKLTRSPGLATT